MILISCLHRGHAVTPWMLLLNLSPEESEVPWGLVLSQCGISCDMCTFIKCKQVDMHTPDVGHFLKSYGARQLKNLIVNKC